MPTYFPPTLYIPFPYIRITKNNWKMWNLLNIWVAF